MAEMVVAAGAAKAVQKKKQNDDEKRALGTFVGADGIKRKSIKPAFYSGG